MILLQYLIDIIDLVVIIDTIASVYLETIIYSFDSYEFVHMK